jgi:hypothetical protein
MGLCAPRRWMEVNAQPKGPAALSPGTETPVPIGYGGWVHREDSLHSVMQASAPSGNLATIPVVQPVTRANIPVSGSVRYVSTVNTCIFIV